LLIDILLADDEKALIQSNLLKVLSVSIDNCILSFEFNIFCCCCKNEIPVLGKVDPNHTIDNAVSKWENEFSQSESTTNKIIPGHVSGMVPFSESHYFPPRSITYKIGYLFSYYS
jgi:hypothetical protein